METTTIEWRHDGDCVPLRIDRAGHGPTVLCLPALSSISTRSEMHPLMEQLKPRCHVVALDWPGFGDLPRPKRHWTADDLSAFLVWALRDIAADAHGIVAAGHAASYVLDYAAARDDLDIRLALLAPTWRGPFPTMLGGRRSWFDSIRKAVDAPILCPALYAANLSGPVLSKMARGHVYSDPAWLTPDRMRKKRAVADAPGARHASVRFVTGGLDRIGSREAFLGLARSVKAPILMIYGEETPPKSRAEMEALETLTNVDTVRLKRGKLAIHEEFASRVAPDLMAFLAP